VGGVGGVDSLKEKVTRKDIYRSSLGKVKGRVAAHRLLTSSKRGEKEKIHPEAQGADLRGGGRGGARYRQGSTGWMRCRAAKLDEKETFAAPRIAGGKGSLQEHSIMGNARRGQRSAEEKEGGGPRCSIGYRVTGKPWTKSEETHGRPSKGKKVVAAAAKIEKSL